MFAHVKSERKGLLEACRGHSIKKEIIESKKFIFECRPGVINDVKRECPGVAKEGRRNFL